MLDPEDDQEAEWEKPRHSENIAQVAFAGRVLSGLATVLFRFCARKEGAEDIWHLLFGMPLPHLVVVLRKPARYSVPLVAQSVQAVFLALDSSGSRGMRS